jgi:hypothetical protein
VVIWLNFKPLAVPVYIPLRFDQGQLAETRMLPVGLKFGGTIFRKQVSVHKVRGRVHWMTCIVMHVIV